MGIDWRGILNKVRRALRHRGSTADDAADFAQEAYLRYEAYSATNVVDKPDAFVMRTALNLSTDAFRLAAVRGEQALSDYEAHACRISTEEQVLLRQRLSQLDALLLQMDKTTSTLFREVRCEGYSYAEVAKRHGISVSAVERRVAKAAVQLAHLDRG